MIGITNASVLPDPVTAYRERRGGTRGELTRSKVELVPERLTSTTTSLLPINIGITLAWTGVIWSNFMSRILSALDTNEGRTSAVVSSVGDERETLPARG